MRVRLSKMHPNPRIPLGGMLLAGSLKLHPYRLQSFCRMPLSTSGTSWTSESVHKISNQRAYNELEHGLRTPREELAFTARPKIHSHSQIFRYGRSIFCLPHRPNFSDIFDLCLHWVSVVRAFVISSNRQN